MANFIADVSVAPTWLWIAFCTGIFLLLLVDLSLFGKGAHKVSRKTALFESGIWIGLALIFNLWFGFTYGRELGLEFLTGYLVEKSLSVDNLFVILLIFSSFRIPDAYQHRVLFYGVLGAIVLRAFFIILGAQLLHLFHWILYVFGAFLVFTGIKMWLAAGKEADLEANPALKWVRRSFAISPNYDGERFFTRFDGKRMATPLLVVVLLIGIVDVVFAVDSIPAIFAITTDPFIVLTSNVFAILGLRAMYFLLAGVHEKFHLLPYGLSLVLVLIGTKMLLIDIYKIPVAWSLVATGIILAVTMILSLCIKPKSDQPHGAFPFDAKSDDEAPKT